MSDARTRPPTPTHDPETDEKLRERLLYVCSTDDKYLLKEIMTSKGEYLDEVAERFGLCRQFISRLDGTAV